MTMVLTVSAVVIVVLAVVGILGAMIDGSAEPRAPGRRN